TAVAGTNYTATSAILTFGPGETSKTFTVGLLDDSLVEGDRTVTLTLSNPAGGAALDSPATATLTVVDADLPVLPDGPPSSHQIDAAKGFAHSREHFQQFVTDA